MSPSDSRASWPTGPVVVLGAVLLGVLLGEHAGPAPAVSALACAMVGGALAATGAVVGRRRLGFACCVVAAACAGVACTCRALDGVVRSPLTAAVRARADAVVDLTLTSDPDASRFAARALGRVDRVRFADGHVSRGGRRTVAIDASSAAASRLAVLDAGDRVRLAGYFRPLDEFEARLRWRHAVGAFSADDLRAFRGPSAPLMRAANWLRGRVLAGHREMPEPQRALVAGFLLGDTGDLPDPVVADFRRAGLSHLVAVSGENVAFVLVLVGPFLRRLPRAARLTAGIGVLVVFAAMTRFEPSVLRACAMAACSMIAIAVGRPTAGLRALALAAIALVLVDPFLVHSVGFRLSCAASVGIAVLGPTIAGRVPGPRWFREALGVTIGAQLAVAPLLVATFGAVPLVAVPANLLAAPMVGPLTISGLVSGVLGGLVGADVVGSVAGFPAYVCASAVLAVARLGAAAPFDLDAVGLVVVVGTALAGVFAGAVASVGQHGGVPVPSPENPTWRYRLGDVVHDLTHRTLVMGILNRTPDSFYDQGATYALDDLLRRAAVLVEEGADLLDVGGVKAGPGPEVGEAEELERVVPSIQALHARFDIALSVDTWRAAVLDEACKAGAVVGNDISGFADPEYVAVASRNGASVVATHIRLAPRVPDPEPHYDDLVNDVTAFLLDRAARAEAAGLLREQIAIDAGLDLGKTPSMSAVLLRESGALAARGYPLLLSASNKRFIGELFELGIDDRREMSLASVAYGVTHGCRIVRVHDVAGTVKICRMVEAILGRRAESAVR